MSLYLGTTPIANTVHNNINSIINSIYPVGSLFFSTASTCPLQDLGIGTWQNVGTSLTLSVNTSVPVKGNGMTLGLTDGSRNYGIYENQEPQIQTAVDYWNKSIGTGTVSGAGDWSNKVFGVTTDSSKSGIVGTVTRTQITVNVFQRIS